jgi:dihydrofolate reductase
VVGVERVLTAEEDLARFRVFQNQPPSAGGRSSGSTSSMARMDALLYGRRTYDEFAMRWPDQRGNRSAEFFNGTHKYVVTSKAAGLDWGPVTQLNGDLAAELVRLKAELGKDIPIQGSTVLVRLPLRTGCSTS